MVSCIIRWGIGLCAFSETPLFKSGRHTFIGAAPFYMHRMFLLNSCSGLIPAAQDDSALQAMPGGSKGPPILFLTKQTNTR